MGDQFQGHHPKAAVAAQRHEVVTAQSSGPRSWSARGSRDRRCRPSQRGSEALGVHRLQQVIERIDFKRANGVLVVRRHEHDLRRAIEMRQQVEAGCRTQLDVEEYDVR